MLQKTLSRGWAAARLLSRRRVMRPAFLIRGAFLLAALLAMVTLAAGLTSTGAWFTDSATTSTHTISSATLLLTINGQDEASQTFMVTNLKPGAREAAGQAVLKNAGTIPGRLWLEIANVRNFENGCLAPENKTGDKSCGTGPDQGELGGLVKISFQPVPANGITYGGLSVVNASSGLHVDLANLEPGQTFTIAAYAAWMAGDSDNLAQGDSVVYDVVFHLDQIH